MYKAFYEHISQCIPCKERSTRAQKRPLETTEVPQYPFAKVALDVAGLFELSWAKNQYLISFICLYSGYPESFATPDHKADTIAHLLFDEIATLYGVSLLLLPDNASELVGVTFTETLKAPTIQHITTTPYCPTSNGLIEHYNGVVKNVIAKYARESPQSWNLYINQALAAVRFNVNQSTGYSSGIFLFI